jgi:NhaP-type Na+/H+ and K+/H+ antiporter
MKLNDVLSHLEALNFIDENDKVVICVCNGKSCKKDDQLFTCDMMVSEAKHFFGELEVILNQTRAYGDNIDYMYSRFWFLLKYDKPNVD